VNATKVNAGPAESNGRLLLGIRRDSLHVTCGLTACTPGSAPDPTLGNEYGKTLPFLPYTRATTVTHSSTPDDTTATPIKQPTHTRSSHGCPIIKRRMTTRARTTRRSECRRVNLANIAVCNLTVGFFFKARLQQQSIQLFKSPTARQFLLLGCHYYNEMHAKSPPPLSYILLLVACGFVVALYWPCASDFSALSTHGLTSTLLIGYGAIYPLLLFTSFLPYLSGADLHIAQLMPLPLTVSCFSKVQIGLPFWYRVTRVHTYTHPFNGPLSGTTRVSRYQKGKTNLDFTEATGSEWQWHQLGHMQVCTRQIRKEGSKK